MNVSVIVTTYERPDALRKVLDGLAFQKRAPEEVIVADDGSGPATKEAVKDFEGKSPFPLKHVWHEDRGFRAAKIRNEAIKASTGGYLIFLDGDCLPDRRFVADHTSLSEQGFFFQGKRVLVGQAASQGFDSLSANSPHELLGLALRGRISNFHHALRAPFFPPLRGRSMKGIKSCNMGIFREDLLAVNGFNEAFVGWGREDSELAARLYKYGLRRKGHPFMAVCFHLWHEETSRENLKRNEGLLRGALQGGDFRCAEGILKERGNVGD